MKRTLLLLGFLLTFLVSYAADQQLRELSLEDAKRAAALIRKQRKLYLYCGCCEGEKARKVRADKVEIYESDTGKEGLYNIRITFYYPRSGMPTTEIVDLAYLWGRKKGVYFTIASVLGMPHDACNPMKRSWE